MTLMEEAIEKVIERKNLDDRLAQGAMEELMSGSSTSASIGAFLAGLRSKGETPAEIAAFARVMREKCISIRPQVGRALVDLCGTGGSKLKTFNISTISTFVVAGAGFPVAKHGNRSNSSQSGSADLLEALGVDLSVSAEVVQNAIEEIGVGFLYAPSFHPAMKHAAGPRKDLGIRTVFNGLGPLTNPASATRQLIGVYDKMLVNKFPRVLQRLGVKRALVVHGRRGLDEISTLGPTYVGELDRGSISEYEIHPSDFGLPVASLKDIEDLPPDESAAVALDLLKGNLKGPKYDIVMLNAGAGIYVAGGADSIMEGIEMARDSVRTGQAFEKLQGLIQKSGTKPKESHLRSQLEV